MSGVIFKMSARCCCDRSPAGCSCDGTYNAWQSGYFDLPARIKMTFDYYVPQSDRATLSCGSGWDTCESQWPCSGISEIEIGFGETPYDWEPAQADEACGFAGCREYNSDGDCIGAPSSCQKGTESLTMSVSHFDFCHRTCSPECNDDTVTDGIGGYYLTEDADTDTPMEDFLETGEVHFERVTWFDGETQRLAYVFDSATYEPGDPVNDSVEWGEEPIWRDVGTNPTARELWTVANMFTTVTSNRCTYPGIGDGAGTSGCRGADSPQYISSQHFRMYIELGTTSDDSICRWRLRTEFVDSMNGNAICTVGAHDCGNLPSTNDATNCPCSGAECDLDDSCWADDVFGEGCCSWQPAGIPSPPLENNVGGDPCDWCGSPNNYGFNCCGCQVAAAGDACVRWRGVNFGGVLDGLGSGNTPLYLFNATYTPTDNLECFTSPFDPDYFHLWGGEDGDTNSATPKIYFSNGQQPDWSTITSPLNLAAWKWETNIRPTMEYGDSTFAYGFIRVTGFEVTEE